MQYGDPGTTVRGRPLTRLAAPLRGPAGGANGGWLFPPGQLENWKEDRMRPHGTRFLTLTAVAASAAMVLASCSSSSSSSSGSGSKAPITVGVSLSQTGDFSVDGQAFMRGYNLWA